MTTATQAIERAAWVAISETSPDVCGAICGLVNLGKTPAQVRARLSETFKSDFVLESIQVAASYRVRKLNGGTDGDL
jgi:hypothetical protein